MIDLNILTVFINEPYNDMNNFNLGYEYELIGQTAIALSYYLRCAEYTSNDNLSYECLIRMSKCITKQGHRDVNELTCLEHAISIKPERPEAYYIMSLYHSYRGNWLKSYMYACIGLINTDIQNTDIQNTDIQRHDLQNANKLIKDIGYYSHNQLLFQKAYSGYNKGKIKESKMIYLNLLDSDINDNYKDIIKSNLTKFSDYNCIDNKLCDNKNIPEYNSEYNKNIPEYNKNIPEYNKNIPELIVVDNFYKDPNYIRNYAIKLDYIKPENSTSVGYTYSIKNLIIDGIKEYFESLLNIKIKVGNKKGEWEYFNNGSFHYGLKNTPIIYHCDKQEYAGVVFLTPDSPVSCGTSIFRNKKENNLINPESCEEVDRIGNIYNRLVLFKSHNIHAVNSYFGDTINNSRLSQLFIFDIQKESYNEISDKDTIKSKLAIENKKNETLIYDDKLYELSNYHNNDKCIFKLYKNCPISDCIRRGYKWEEHNHEIIDKYVKKDFICVEVGSHIGSISLKLSKSCKYLYCFEPLKESFELLKLNLKNNNCNNVYLYNLALSNENKKSNIDFISTNNPGGAGLFYNSQIVNSDIISVSDNYPVELITLDSLNIEKIDYLKIDVEGYEENVILGAYETIKRCNPVIIMEIYKDMISFNKLSISEIQIRYKNIIELGYSVNNIWGNDYIFIKDNKNKLDIVLQGKFNENVLHIAEYYLELNFVNNIIISCWDNDSIPQINNDRIKIIQSEVPENPGTGQRNLQIISSLTGIKESETEFIIKIRNDQRYTHESMINMYNFYEQYKERKLTFYYDEGRPRNRICVSGNFSEFSFHPRDHLFWGNKEDLIDLFSLPLEIGKVTDKIKFIVPEDYSLYYEYFIRTETYIGSHYLSNFDQKINYYLLDPKKYLYDNSEKYGETRELSDKLTPQVFKSFPREGIDLEWYKYKWKTYPYENQRSMFGERWHEDGL